MRSQESDPFAAAHALASTPFVTATRLAELRTPPVNLSRVAGLRNAREQFQLLGFADYCLGSKNRWFPRLVAAHFTVSGSVKSFHGA
jgi:hypothetical protein